MLCKLHGQGGLVVQASGYTIDGTTAAYVSLLLLFLLLLKGWGSLHVLISACADAPVLLQLLAVLDVTGIVFAVLSDPACFAGCGTQYCWLVSLLPGHY